MYSFSYTCTYVHTYMHTYLYTLSKPCDHDLRSRKFVLKYFGYKPGDKGTSCNRMVVLVMVQMILRDLMFAKRHQTDFHAVYIVPLLLLFLVRVTCVLFVIVVTVMILYEWTSTRKAWSDAHKDLSRRAFAAHEHQASITATGTTTRITASQ
jgi:hypothetical protein